MAQSAKQKAAQARLKKAAKAAKAKGLKGQAFRTFVGNATRGKGGRSKKPGKAVAKRPGNPSPATGETTPAKPPRMGAAYQSARTGVAALAPATEVGVLALNPGFTLRTAAERQVAQIRARPAELLAHELVVGADAAVDKKMGQAAAISRRSATAILPEVYAGFKAYEAQQGVAPENKPRAVHTEVIRTEFGYNPQQNVQVLNDPGFRIYRIAKHGGQLVRWLRGAKNGKPRFPFIRRATEPV